MIQANELRENNKLSFLGEVVTFDYITKKRDDGVFWIKVKEQNIEHKNIHFQPIELTEELLLKCGFVKDMGEYSIDNFNFVINARDYIVYTNDEFDYKEICKIYYLHQLQNLYFALTQTELKITL